MLRSSIRSLAPPSAGCTLPSALLRRSAFATAARVPAARGPFMRRARCAGLSVGHALALATPSQLAAAQRLFHSSTVARAATGGGDKPDKLAGFHQVQHRAPDEEKDQSQSEEDDANQGPGQGYLPFPPPFHTINIISVLFLANVIAYVTMNWIANDDWRDWIVDHFTVSVDNWHRVYPLLTCAFYQEHPLQLAIDCWLLWQFGNTMLGFFGGGRMLTFWVMCTVGGSLIHIARQHFELHYGIDPLEVRGRCFGPNPFILGLVAVEGLIFRHLNFMQSPPVPFLVLTAFVMVLDVWRIFTTKPAEHGASTGGALVAYLFWLMPTRFMGLDKLTAAL